jgi:two-component system NtrC family sensor kinase
MRAQEELINAEKLASLGRMAAGVAHELNSPLTGIVTFAHLLKDRLPPQDKEAQEDLQVIIEQAERCSKIIKGLLGFSRKAAYEKVELSLNDLLEATLGMVRNQARFHNIQFRIEMAPDLRPVVADPNQLQQVFLNMLINAADAMEERGQITMCTRNIKVDERDFVEVEFTDTGPGIPPEHLGKIFEPFFTTKPVGKGTGLGLSVSYGIVKRHGGDILVRSSPGKGASFFIRLPASPQGEARA